MGCRTAGFFCHSCNECSYEKIFIGSYYIYSITVQMILSHKLFFL